MSCTRLRCDALPNDVVAGVASPLIGWLLLLTISSYILRKVDYKFSRITSWVAQLPIVAKVLPAHPARTISGEVRRATGYHCLLRLYALLVQLLVLLPYVYLLVWMVVAVLEVKEYYDEFRFPVLMGLSVFVLGSVITIGWYGVAHWVRESYRMTAVPRTCFGLCALLLLLLQIGYVFIVIDTYESLYVVMMCYNLVPWLLTGHLNRFIRDPLTFRSVLQLTPENADEMAVSVVQQQQALVLFWMRFWYIVSYVILFLFAVLADLALDHDAGWQIVLAVFVIDVTLMLHDNAGLETDPNIVAALAVLGRLSLFAFGTSRWFLGVSINYAMFSALMMYHLVNQWYPIVDPDEELDELVGGIESALERQAMDAQLYRPEDRLGGGLAAVVNSGVIGAVLKKTGVQSLFRRLGSPWAALIALNFLFGVYVGVAAVASLLNLDMEEELFPPIAITADAHPQYLYGLFTIIFVWGSFLALRAWRTLKVSMLEQGYAHRHAMQAYQERLRIIKQEDQPVEFADVVAELQPERLVNHDFRYTWSVIVSAILFVLITSGASVVLWALTKSNVVLAAGTTTPLLAVLATASYIDFHAKDFRWNDYLTRKRRLKAMHDEIHKICRRTDDRVRDLIETRKIRAATGGSEAELARKTGDVRLSVRASEGDGLDDPKADEEKATGMCSCLFSCCRYIYLRLGAIRDFVMFKHSRSDYRIVFTSAGVAALCFTAGLVLRVADDWYAGWGLGDVLGIIVGTFFLLSKFINSHRFSSVLFLLLFGMLSQFGTYLGQAGAPPLIIVAVFYLYLGVLFLIMGVTLWRDQRWEMTFTVRKYLGVFIFCTLVLTSAALAEVNTAAVYIGGAVAYLVVVFLVFTGIRWSTQHFYLSYRHRVAAAVICVLLTIVVLFVLIVSDFYWFWAFTAFAVLYGVFVAAMTAQDLSESDTRRLFPSRWIFPIYRYDPRSFEGSQGLKQFNRGHKLYFLLCASLMVWGAMCALLVEPAFVGWIFYAAGLLMAWAMFLQLRYARVREFWTAWQNCAKSPLVIDRARQQAIDTELRAATDMFESASDAKAKRAMSSRDTEDEEGILSLLGMPFRSDTRVTDLPSDRPPPGEEHIETEHDEDEDESKRDSVAAEVEEEAADEAAEFDMRHEDEEALNYLEAIRRLWQWEEQSELPVLINKRKLVSRALRRVVAGHHSEESLERQRHIIGLLNEVDEQIRTTYLEQTRMVVKFMVNLIISAASLRNKRRQVLKDFFRALKTKAFGAASHLADMSPAQMKAWLKEDPENHGAELEAAKRRFVEYQTELAITSERLAEEEAQLHKERTRRMEELRLAERKRRAAAADHQSSVELLNMLTRGQEVTTFDDPEQVRAALQERLREYREGHGGDKFEDEQFKLRAKELGKTFSDHSLGVARGGTLTTKLFDPEPTPDEIKQGDLGDCYLLSAISVLADPTNPARVRNLFLTDQFNELGMYAAQFYHDGSWNAVVVDDNLPVKDDNFAFAQTRLRDRRALWVPLLEKCYAKYFRGYDRIEGGLVHECLVHLTGGSAVEIDIGSSIQGVGALDGMLFSQLLEYRKRGYLMGCGNPAGKQSQSGVANAQGIVQGHAYAILDVREVLGDSGEKLRMMKLKNPWADDSEWNGDWGDNSPLWTRRLEGLLGLERGDDGIFWMSFTDFVSQFRKIYICRIFDNVEAYSYDMRRGVWERDEENDRSTGARGDGAEPQRWLRKQITGQWKGKTAVGCPRNPNSHRNPHYLLRVDRDDTPVFLSLAEPAKIDPADYARKAFYVLKKGDGSAAVRISKFKKREVVSEKMTFPVRQREVSTEVRLEAGFSYTIFVTTYKPQEADFILTAYSPRDFELRPMPDDADQVS